MRFILAKKFYGFVQKKKSAFHLLRLRFQDNLLRGKKQASEHYMHLNYNKKKRGGRALSIEVLNRERVLGPGARHPISGPPLLCNEEQSTVSPPYPRMLNPRIQRAECMHYIV